MLILKRLSVLLVMLSGNAMAIEEPKYEVIEKNTTFEIRRYEPMIVAETEVEGDFDEVGNDAFGLLAGYIFGKNEEGAEMEMTAPVSQMPSSENVDHGTATTLISNTIDKTSGGEGNYLITFVMPSEFNMDTLPKPDDDRVQLKEIPEKLMAAKSYSGSWSQGKYTKHEELLMDGLHEAGYEAIGEPIFARYNSPFTIPMLRRNEVLVEVAEVPSDASAQ